MKKTLFICTANRDRSRTAEIYFQNKYPEYRFRSAGINKHLSERHGGLHIKKYMLDEAQRIICMEQVHADYILTKIDKKYKAKIEVLNLGDTETFMSPSLIDLLETKFTLPNPKPAMRKVCYTVITGNYDTLQQPEVITPGWEYVCYIDKAGPAKNVGVWQMVRFSPEENPALHNRRLKILCPIKPEKGQWLRTIYVDGNQTITGNLDSFVENSKHPLGGFTAKKHPTRNCAYQEAQACLEFNKDTPTNIKKTVNYLRKQKFKKNAGLSENGILIRDYNDPAGTGQLSRAMKRWEKMTRLYSHRDQLSLPFVLSKYPKVKLNKPSLSAFKSFFKYVPHNPTPKAKEVLPKKIEPAAPPVPKYNGSDLTIYVTATPEQMHLVPQFVVTALATNQQAFVEVLMYSGTSVPLITSIPEKQQKQLSFYLHDWLQTTANGNWDSYRFLIEPNRKTKYVYAVGVETPITEPLLEKFLPLMQETKLRYHNRLVGPNQFNVNHFSEYSALYGHPFTPHTAEVRTADSKTLLFNIVAAMGNLLPEDKSLVES